MSERVTDDMVHGFLAWARNYGEIESFERLDGPGRKWIIRLRDETITASGIPLGWTEQRAVPTELALTSREALVFGYGLAVAGARTELRRDFAVREWGWGGWDR